MTISFSTEQPTSFNATAQSGRSRLSRKRGREREREKYRGREKREEREESERRDRERENVCVLGGKRVLKGLEALVLCIYKAQRRPI